MVLKKLHSQSHAGGFWAPFCMYVGISLLYASVAGSLVSFVEPLAAGSGIAEVKTYLNGIHIRGLLTVRAPRILPACCTHAHQCMGCRTPAGCLVLLHLPLSLASLLQEGPSCATFSRHAVSRALDMHLRVVPHESVAAWVSCGPNCKRMLCSTWCLTFLNRPFL